MPPRIKISKKEIIAGGIDFIRKVGVEALCARSLAKWLGISTQPIFSNFENMDELIDAITLEAREISFEYTKKMLESGVYPPYKTSGMAYIKFAKEERELFRLLFMDGKNRLDNFEGYEKIIEGMRAALNTTSEIAREIHFHTWSFVHGIATMINTDFLSLEDEVISEMLTNIYEGLKFRYNLTATPKSK